MSQGDYLQIGGSIASLLYGCFARQFYWRKYFFDDTRRDVEMPMWLGRTLFVSLGIALLAAKLLELYFQRK